MMKGLIALFLISFAILDVEQNCISLNWNTNKMKKMLVIEIQVYN